jgi:hypothetical protein
MKQGDGVLASGDIHTPYFHEPLGYLQMLTPKAILHFVFHSRPALKSQPLGNGQVAALARNVQRPLKLECFLGRDGHNPLGHLQVAVKTHFTQHRCYFPRIERVPRK